MNNGVFDWLQYLLSFALVIALLLGSLWALRKLQGTILELTQLPLYTKTVLTRRSQLKFISAALLVTRRRLC